MYCSCVICPEESLLSNAFDPNGVSGFRLYNAASFDAVLACAVRLLLAGVASGCETYIVVLLPPDVSVTVVVVVLVVVTTVAFA